MSTKPSIPKGTRDFLPDELVKRDHVFNTIASVYGRFGFQKIETPTIENLNTLLGKYGDEGDKLLFRILNSGDFLSKVPQDVIDTKNSSLFSAAIAEKGLRYDLTVPFARFVVQHRNELIFPFRRYQIQPVWRADKPQKGRYREFFQCDADIIGSDSLLNELELIQIMDHVFSALGVPVTIRFNNRKILAGIADIIGAGKQFTALTVIIDKMDKIGITGVIDELKISGFSDEGIETVKAILLIEGDNAEKVDFLAGMIQNTNTGAKGIEEVKQLLKYLESFKAKNKVILDATLARGLNYYTGAIFEVTANDVKMGSLCGGGRYDDLTGIFGWEGVSGVGISFGADRIVDVMEQMQCFDLRNANTTRVLFVNFGGDEEQYALKALMQIRYAGIVAEIYPDPVKMKKQMSYANERKIPFVVIAGSKERENSVFTLKDMVKGTQEEISLEELISKL
ncbi:MAG: histidine--tRNA ligase [Bacteroidales bacterium]|nr:histidine--tRNA ligase [Bacteroidales bacterium]